MFCGRKMAPQSQSKLKQYLLLSTVVPDCSVLQDSPTQKLHLFAASVAGAVVSCASVPCLSVCLQTWRQLERNIPTKQNVSQIQTTVPGGPLKTVDSQRKKLSKNWNRCVWLTSMVCAWCMALIAVCAIDLLENVINAQPTGNKREKTLKQLCPQHVIL